MQSVGATVMTPLRRQPHVDEDRRSGLVIWYTAHRAISGFGDGVRSHPYGLRLAMRDLPGYGASNPLLKAALPTRVLALLLLEPVVFRATELTGYAESPGGMHGMLDAYPAAVSELIRAFGGAIGR